MNTIEKNVKQWFRPIQNCFPLYAILLGTTIRLIYTLYYPLLLGDGYEYHQTAVNMLKYGIFSRSEHPPIEPTYTRVPGYSLFLAGIYFAFGTNYQYVLVIQVILSAITAYWIYRMILDSPIPYAKQIAYAFLSLNAIYFRADIFVNHVLSETLTSFITVGIAYYLVHQKNLYKTAFLAGYAMILRVDMVVLPVFMVFFLWLYRKQYPFTLNKIVVCSFILLTPITVWTIRNAITFNIFMPLSAPFPVHSVSKSGFALWCKTWITRESEMQKGHWSIMFCEYQDFGKADIPEYAFSSEQEKNDILQIQRQINSTHIYTAKMDSIFRHYAYEHIRKKPIKVLLFNPLRTAWHLWVHTGSEYFWFLQGIALSDAIQQPFTGLSGPKILLSGVYVLLLIFAFVGIIYFVMYKLWRYSILVLMLLLWLHRTGFYMFLFLPEHRYMTSAVWIVWIFAIIGVIYMYQALKKKKQASESTVG